MAPFQEAPWHQILHRIYVYLFVDLQEGHTYTETHVNTSTHRPDVFGLCQPLVLFVTAQVSVLC